MNDFSSKLENKLFRGVYKNKRNKKKEEGNNRRNEREKTLRSVKFITIFHQPANWV